jgi:hypothetical protein
MSSDAPARVQVADPAHDSREQAALAAVGESLRAERDRAICGAHHHGVPIAAIARMMKMSDQDISEIVGS